MMSDTNTARRMTAGEMARLRSPHCEGCGRCCRGMGDTIHLDPLDVMHLSVVFGKNLSGLIEDRICGMHVEDGLVLPHLCMDAGTDACVLLGEDGRCTRHAARPGLCRLYPLGREYGETGIRYFLTQHECPEGPMSKVRIRDWIGIRDFNQYEEYLCAWHALTGRQKNLCGKALAAGRGSWARKRNTQLLADFYLNLPETEEAFYETFARQLGQRPWTRAAEGIKDWR